MDQTLPTEQELEAMRTVDVHKVDPETLRDIRDVQIKTELPKHERMLDFLRQIGNPYCYRHGKYVVNWKTGCSATYGLNAEKFSGQTGDSLI